MPDTYAFDTATTWSGQHFGVSDWITVDQSKIQQFADCTGDQQWIHVDPERCAAQSPFGAPIAHGFLTLSLLAKLLMDLGIVPADASRAINAGVNAAAFKQPVLSGQRVRARVDIKHAETKGDDRVLIITACELEIENSEKPALQAELVVMLFR